MSKWKRNYSKERRWQRNHLFMKYGNVCHICNKPFASIKDATFDHLVPFSKGGFDVLENYRLAHSDCNQLKADMTPEEFTKFQLSTKCN